MNRLIAIIAFALAVGSLFYAGCSAQGAQAGAAPPALIALQATARNTTAPTATATPIPTATVGYQATIDAMAADNLQKSQEIAYLLQTQTWATAEADRRAHELVLLTAQSDMLTATAALTAIPATETRQAIQNTQIAGNATLVVGQWTATAGAPTQAVAMARAQAEANTADLRATADAVSPLLGWLFGLLVVGGLLFIVARRAPAALPDETPAEAERPIVNHVHQDTGDPWAFNTRRIPPPPGETEKIRLWATFVVNGESVAVDRWEKTGTPFTRTHEYRHGIYQWAVGHDLTELNKRGERVLNDLGVKIVTDWLENNPLPTDDLAQKDAPLPSTRMDTTRMEPEGEVLEEGEPFPAG